MDRKRASRSTLPGDSSAPEPRQTSMTLEQRRARRARWAIATAVAACCSAAALVAMKPANAFSVNNVFDVFRGTGIPVPQRGDLGTVAGEMVMGGGANLPGDKRFAKGEAGLALTKEEQARAARAGSVFATVLQGGGGEQVGPNLAWARGSTEGELQRLALERVSARLQGARELTAQDVAEARAALSPFMLAYLSDRAAGKGQGPLLVPARSAREFSVAAYSLDERTPAPQPSEVFQLLPASTLVPPDLQRTYLGLLKGAAASGNSHFDATQLLIWAMRSQIKGQGMPGLTAAQQRVLLDADPNALVALQRYAAKAGGKKLVEDVARIAGEQYAGKQASEAAWRVLQSPEARYAGTILGDVRNIAQAGSAPGALDGYSLVGEDVAAHVVSDGGTRVVRIGVANARDKPAVFLAGKCVAQSVRLVSRLGLQGPGPTGARLVRAASTLVAPVVGTDAPEPQGVCGLLAWGAKNGVRLPGAEQCPGAGEGLFAWPAVVGDDGVNSETLGMAVMASCEGGMPNPPAETGAPSPVPSAQAAPERNDR